MRFILGTVRVVMATLVWSVPASAQQAPPSSAPPAIQDNSFLIEEAYNQGAGVVQHISSLTRFWDSKDWIYTFTQEWPAPRDPRHQLSYTLPVQRAGAFPDSGAGIGDVLLNYRYQLVGDADSRLAISPRFSLLVSSGDSTLGRGTGGVGYQVNLPVSFVLTPTVTSHWNAGVTIVPRAHNADGDRASTTGFNYGQSFVWLVHPRINLMLETVGSASQAVDGPDRTTWSRSFFLSPGVRWSYNFANGLQIVPGAAVPLGVGPSKGEKGILFYLSFEHPFRKMQ